MKLRKLEMKDAPLMLEWMHDESVVENLAANFAAKKIEDCEAFIEFSKKDENNLNLAIVDENDEYMGTASLKHINRESKNAEFAIAMRTCAMGKGFSKYGMAEIIRVGLEEMGLDEVYWCVSPVNKRAVRFYDKNGYPRVPHNEIKCVGYTEEQIKEFIWYSVKKA
ncbi:MAG: GNAT family N-acetyltransferase [Clostridia bacterium]|nr:GNAT family N-acetyltransferase [Clostridia bacterium]